MPVSDHRDIPYVCAFINLHRLIPSSEATNLTHWNLTAHLWKGSFRAAVELSAFHACCLRACLHQCQGSSSEAGFHAPQNNCPYSTPIPLAAFTGLESAKVKFSAPAVAGLVAHTALDHGYRADGQQLSARGPPLSLL